MPDDVPIPEPASIAEVESLILKLYDPVSPAVVASIQDVLQRLQRSPQAWILARELLSRPSEKVRFFGALTLIVKLNTDSASLKNEEADELFNSILGWLVESAVDGSSSLVTRKLSSALVIFFLHFPTHGHPCLRRLLCSLYLRRHASTDEIAEFWSVQPAFEPRILETAVVFATDLIDEAGKVDVNSAEHLENYQCIRDSVHDAAALISAGLSPGSGTTPPELSLKQSSVKCLLAWVTFSHRFFSLGDPLLDPLRSLLPTVLEVVSLSSEIFTSSMELFSELLSSHQGFLTRQHITMLLEFCKAPLGHEHYSRLVQGDDSFECVQFGLFILALGESHMDTLLSEVHDASSHHLLEQLCGLLEVKGYPVAEDRIFVPAVEFWSTVVEALADHVFSDDTSQSQPIHRLKEYSNRAVHSAYLKIMFPTPEVFSDWDSTDREGFIDARKDVADLLQAMYAISGKDLVARLTDLILHALAGTRWVELEAAAFCLGAIADCVSGDPTYDEFLSAVFSPTFFSMVQPGDATVPLRTRQSCIALIEKYADYFERDTSSLPNALNLLFSVMDDPLLGGPASKSIHRLCRSCRSALVSEAGTFLAEYRTLATHRQLDCLANERIVGAIAAVIQALDTEGARVAAVHQLLDILFGDAEACLVAVSNPGLAPSDSRLYRCGSRCLTDVPPGEIPAHASIRVLRCLVSIGKGLQAPADIPVDIDSDDLGRTGARDSSQLVSLHTRIIAVVSELQKAFPANGEMVEIICSIFRAGFAESSPGPFVFAPDVVGNYLTQHRLSTPRIGALVSAACSFVSSKSPKIPGWQDIMASLTGWVIGLMRELPAADSDTELSQNGIDFVCRLFVKDPSVLLQPQQRESLAFFFAFTLGVLDGKEPLPKATAAEFWATFVSHKPRNSECQDLVNQAMAEMGPLVTLSLIRNIGGNASRSELDKLSEPLKKLASSHPSAQSWIHAALFHPTFPGKSVSDQEKLSFMRKVVSLRGARMTNQVAREFWLLSRGSKFSYAT